MVGTSFGDRVRAARTARAMGSRELDRLAGLTEGHVAVLEQRRTGAQIGTASKLAAALGVGTLWLMTGAGKMVPAAGAPPFPRKKKVRA